MSERLRWGILGTGNIARQFANGLAASARGSLTAVASRDSAKANAFAAKFQGVQTFGDYEALLQDPSVQAVYVSLPNTMHHEWTIKALRSGKHVLCEKPFSVTTSQAEEMFDEAGRAGRVAMEALMYRCHPMTLSLLDAVRSGVIGTVKLIRTGFCFKTTRIEGNIRFQPELAGGSLMDVGSYCLSFSRLIAGSEPTEVYVSAKIHESGVDEWAAGVLRFGNDVAATFTCGMTVQADNTAMICGSDGYIEIPIPWKPPAQGAQYVIARSTPPRMDSATSTNPPVPPRQTVTVDAGGDVYGVEADHFAAVVLDGMPPAVSPQDTVGNMRLLERIAAELMGRDIAQHKTRSVN